MNAFWWFRDNEIAGFARPGFNCTHWFDYPFDEAMVMSWLGQFPTAEVSLKDFKRHLASYTPKVLPFYDIPETADEVVKKFMNPDVITKALKNAMKRTKKIAEFKVTDTHVKVNYCDDRLVEEINHLKEKGISKIVSLTERHLNAEKLNEHFDLHHFSIEDMGAPTFEQAEELSEIVKDCREKKETLGVHCMAGIGRTTTMIVSAELILGATLEEMKLLIAKKNPKFQFVGSQARFMEDVAKKYSSLR